MKVLALRNIKIFFRDKVNVFFSMLVVLITLGLYILFLGENLRRGMNIPNATALTDNWIMAGLVATTSLSTTLGAFGIMVNDKATKVDKDFLATPISHAKRVGGYTLGTFAVGLIMTLFTFGLAQLYLFFSHGDLLSATEYLYVLGVILLSVMSSTAMMYFIVELFQSPMAFETAVSILSTIVGFLAGIYIPLGVLPRVVQYAGMLFPVTHGAALLRQALMNHEIAEAFGNAPQEQILDFEILMGNRFYLGDQVLSPLVSILFLIGSIVFFFVAAVLLSKRKKR